MIINYDRTPYRRTGRHGSRVQAANHRRRTGWQEAKNRVRGSLAYYRQLDEQERAWTRHKERQEARGVCPHSGETFRDCKASDLCDCFDYPQHEHYRQERREPDDEDRAELADLLGADMVRKLLNGPNGTLNGNPNRGSL